LENVKPYEQSNDAKKKQVSNMFNNIAPYYDMLNHLLSMGVDKGWRKKMIKILNDQPHDLIVDVATGTADVAIAMAKTLNVQKIVGIDIAQQMLDIGTKKIAKANLSEKISLEWGDSENLRFESNTVSAVTVAFGVRNFENVEAGLSEMYRILQPGGKVVILEFSKPRVFPLKQLYHFYFRRILPVVGRITSKDKKAYSYLYESVQAFPDGVDFTKLLDQTGFSQSTWKPLTFGICSIYTGIK
jgi:demethylmenaquinone methyltransferase/2-methoxy-6-polyprenyl-1,4-benzoquinol methylase